MYLHNNLTPAYYKDNMVAKPARRVAIDLIELFHIGHKIIRLLFKSFAIMGSPYVSTTFWSVCGKPRVNAAQ